MTNSALAPSDATSRSAHALFRALNRLPLVRVGPDDAKLSFALRQAGEIIEDPDCADDFETLTSGIFQRFPKITGDETTFIYLAVCPANEEGLNEHLQALSSTMSPLDMAGIGIEAAFQSMQHDDNAARQVRLARGRTEYLERLELFAAIEADQEKACGEN